MSGEAHTKKNMTFRSSVRKLLPSGLVQNGRRLVTFARRTVAWVEVLTGIRGRSALDRRAVGRSIFNARRAIFERPDQWVDPYLVCDAQVEVRGSGAFEVRGYCDDLAHVLPSHNMAVLRAMRGRLKPGDVAIDAGANIGAVTVPMARLVGREGRILAIEMMPDTARQLQRNLALNGLSNVKVVQAALSDQENQTVQAFVPQGGFHGQASITRAPDRAGDSIEVQTATLDRLLSDYPQIALVKMDLEGAEAAALGGCQEALKRIKAVLFESWGRDGGEVRSILERAGFAIHPVDSRNQLAIRPAGEPS